MKRVLWISGIITILLLPMILTGMADADDAVKKALRLGNRQYAEAGYEEALKSYEAGLAVSPEDKALNFNAAQAAFMLAEYEKAIEYYGKSEDSIDKFLNSGNASLRMGSDSSDDNEKAQYYIQAMQTYLDGIIKFPQDVPLKYNFETVKEKIEALPPQDEQDQESQNENSENSQDTQDENSEQNQNSEQDQNDEQSQDSEQDQNDEQSQNEEQSQEDGQEEPYSQEEGEYEQDQEAIERILQMLESQEEESLKNNKDVVSRKEDKYGW